MPIFKNRTPWTVTPAVGMEMDLTRAVVREIELKTPYKVLSCDADTELRGTILSFTKTLLNYTQFNTVREAKRRCAVELIWRDLPHRRGPDQAGSAGQADPLRPSPERRSRCFA